MRSGSLNRGSMNAKFGLKLQRRIDRMYGRGDGKLVKDFTPQGRSGLYIYAVVVKQHPAKVKIGMTRKWKSRRLSYANWDLSPGDAIEDERVFCICEEFVDLEKLEQHILVTFPYDRAFGNEWFHASIEDAARHIDRVMCEHNISYDL